MSKEDEIMQYFTTLDDKELAIMAQLLLIEILKRGMEVND